MKTDLVNLPCGTVEIRVSEDNMTAKGWVSSHHLVPPKERQLRSMIRQKLWRAYKE